MGEGSGPRRAAVRKKANSADNVPKTIPMNKKSRTNSAGMGNPPTPRSRNNNKAPEADAVNSAHTNAHNSATAAKSRHGRGCMKDAVFQGKSDSGTIYK